MRLQLRQPRLDNCQATSRLELLNCSVVLATVFHCCVSVFVCAENHFLRPSMLAKGVETVFSKAKKHKAVKNLVGTVKNLFFMNL